MGEEFLHLSHEPWVIRMCVRLLLAALLGALVGLEREHHGRTAGLRTQLLVALGSALVVVVSVTFTEVFAPAAAAGALRIDPSRAAYGVITGIGFLGAGVIARYGFTIRGVTTAASLWCTAAIGMACGLGMFGIAAFTTAVVVTALLFLGKIDSKIPSRSSRTITIQCRISQRNNFEHFRTLLKQRKLEIDSISYSRAAVARTETLIYQVEMAASQRTADLNWFADDPEILEYRIE